MKIDNRLPQMPRLYAAPHNANLRAKAKQVGLSLVELMVAVTIGLFLMLVVANLFIGSKQTYTNQDNLSRLQENGRFAIALMGKAIREAGYHNMSFNPPAGYYAANAPKSPTWPYSPGILVITGTEGTSGAPDSITLAQDSPVDCLNAALAVPAQNKYSINSSQQLICTSLPNSNAVGVLLDGVEDLQILYGEKVSSAYRYVSQPTVSNWDNVNAVRICMLMRTAAGGLTTTPQHYTDCKGNSVTATDGRIREAFSETFTIRSRIPN